MTKEADDNFKRWLKINNAITKIFKDDLDYIINHNLMIDDIADIKAKQNPKLLTATYQQIISIETLLLLDEILVRKTNQSFITYWNTIVGDDLLWPKFYKKLIKYRPWIQKLAIDKFALIVKDKLNEQKED